MLSRLREHFGTAGLIVAIVALSVAISGGAIAANGGNGDGSATASAKKGKKGPRGPKGPKGDAGAAGPAGAKGDKGDTGAAGANGSNGAAGAAGKNGVSVTSTSLGEGDEDCEFGGSEFKAANGTTFACNGAPGEDGEPWTPEGVLPPGATETGAWAFAGAADEATVWAPISFQIPLPEALPAAMAPGQQNFVHYIRSNGQESIIDLDLESPTFGQQIEVTSTTCLGTAVEPKANPGHLCVYEKVMELLQAGMGGPPTTAAIVGAGTQGFLGADVTGAYLELKATGAGGRAAGTFAVTAPE